MSKDKIKTIPRSEVMEICTETGIIRTTSQEEHNIKRTSIIEDVGRIVINKVPYDGAEPATYELPWPSHTSIERKNLPA